MSTKLRSSCGHLSAPLSDSDYHLAPNYSSIQIILAQTRWGCVVSLPSSYGHLSAPSSDSGNHLALKYSIKNPSPFHLIWGGLCKNIYLTHYFMLAPFHLIPILGELFRNMYTGILLRRDV